MDVARFQWRRAAKLECSSPACLVLWFCTERTVSMAFDPKHINIDVDNTTGQTSLARIFGFSGSRIAQLVRDGVFVQVARGKYNIVDNVQRYIKHITKDAVKDDDINIERQKRIAEADLKKHKAEMAELQLREMKLELYEAEDIEAVISDLVYAVRGNLLSLPGRLSVQLVGINTAAEMSKIIQDEVGRMLLDLSRYQYDPKVFRDRVNARNQVGTPGEETDEV